MLLINIKNDNKTDYKRMARQYAIHYTYAAIDWFDTKSGAKSVSVN